MKKSGLFLILVLSASLLSCSKGQEPQPEGPTEPLEMRYSYVITNVSQNVETNDIISGNGDYTLVYPKNVTMWIAGGSDTTEIPYPDYLDIVSISIDEPDNIVIIEFEPGEYNIQGLFMVKDAKGERVPFEVWYFEDPTPMIGGPHDDVMRWEAEDPGKDYWVNY